MLDLLKAPQLRKRVIMGACGVVVLHQTPFPGDPGSNPQGNQIYFICIPKILVPKIYCLSDFGLFSHQNSMRVLQNLKKIICMQIFDNLLQFQPNSD